MKKCTKCRLYKELENFYNNRRSKDGLFHRCKDCISEYKKENKEEINQKQRARSVEYRKNNVEQIRQGQKEYHEKNKAKINKRKKEYRKNNKEKTLERTRKYRLENREKVNKAQREYAKERIKNDPNFRTAHYLRVRTRKVILVQNGVKSESTEKLLGCTFAEARVYIESQFTEGMSWENYGEWEIDHIRPCASFDLTDPEQQKICFHYTNLRPLSVNENRSKGSLWNGTRYKNIIQRT